MSGSSKWNTLARGQAELFPSLPAKVSGWKPQIDNTGRPVGRVIHQQNHRGTTTTPELETQPRDLVSPSQTLDLAQRHP